MLFQSFDEDSLGLPGRAPFAQPEAAHWMGLHAFLSAMDSTGLGAVFARQPQLRQILLQRAAACVQASGADAHPEATAHALKATVCVLRVRCRLHTSAAASAWR